MRRCQTLHRRNKHTSESEHYGAQIQPDPRSVPKIKINSTCVTLRPRNILERSEGLADSTEHHLQEIQGIDPHVSGRSSNKSTQPGHLSHLDSHRCTGSQKTTTPASLDYVTKLCFYVGTIQMLGFIFREVLFGIQTFSPAWILIFHTCCIYMYIYFCLFSVFIGR
jgi:hypothetical protein